MYREFEVGERPARVIFLGMQSDFSHPSLRGLLEAGVEVRAVIVPATQDAQDDSALRRLEPPSRRRVLLPVNQSFLHTSVQQLAWEHHIPLWEVARLEKPPFPGELGKRIYEHVSQEAYNMWPAQSTLIINHYGLNMADPEARKILREQMEEFFFRAGQ